MKKYILIFALGAMISSCQDSSSSKTTDNISDSTLAPATIEENTPTVKDLEKDKTQLEKKDYSNQETHVSVYRSDGFRPNMASEWIQIRVNSDMDKVLEILYWNVQDEEKMKLEIVSQEYSEGEISGFTGELHFPNDSGIIGFGIIEDRFNLTPEGEKMQEFLYEDK